MWGSAPRGRSNTRKALLAVLLVLFLISIYLEVPLVVTESLFVPSILTFAFLVPVLAVIYYKRIYAFEITFLYRVLIVLSLTAFLSPGFEHLDQKLLGVFQTVVSVVAGVLLLKLLEDVPRRWVIRILLALSTILVAGATLEVAGVLSAVSDSFREAAYGESTWAVYESEARDAQITGFTRPKFFASEPSLLAIGFFAFINCWLLLSYSRRNLAITCAGTLLMLVLTGSLVPLFSLIVSAAIMLYQKDNALDIVGFVTCAYTLGLALAFTKPDIASNMLGRLDEIFGSVSYLNPSSEDIRLVFPLTTLVDVYRESPLFGVGMSGKEVIERYSSLPIDPELALGTNALTTFFTYTGLVGSLLLLKVFRDYWRAMRLRQVGLLVVFILVLSLSLGGFETPRFWGYMFLFVAVMKMRSETAEQRQGITPARHARAESRRPVVESRR